LLTFDLIYYFAPTAGANELVGMGTVDRMWRFGCSSRLDSGSTCTFLNSYSVTYGSLGALNHPDVYGLLHRAAILIGGEINSPSWRTTLSIMTYQLTAATMSPQSS